MSRLCQALSIAGLLFGACATGYGEGIDRAPDAGGDNLDQMRPPSDAGPIVADGGPKACTEGMARTVDPVTGHCLIYFQTGLTWEGAEQACKALGSTTHLVVVQSESENELLRSMIGNGLAWIGGNDKTTEGTFAWLDGAAWVYQNWDSNEPNNGNGNEDCAMIRGDRSGTWDDRACAQSAGYLCERE